MSAIWKVVAFPEEREQEVIDMREFIITVNSTVDLPKEWLEERHVPACSRLQVSGHGKSFRSL